MTEKLDSMDSMEMPPPPPPSTARRSSRKRKPLGNRTNTKAPATASKKAKQSSSKAAAAAAATATSSDRRSTRRSTRMSTAAASTGAGTTTSARATRRSTRMSTAAAAEVVEAAKQLESATFKTPMPPSQQARGRVPAATPALAAGLPQTPFLRQIKRGESLMYGRLDVCRFEREREYCWWCRCTPFIVLSRRCRTLLCFSFLIY